MGYGTAQFHVGMAPAGAPLTPNAREGAASFAPQWRAQSPQGAVVGVGVEEKVSALSRRTQAELLRAERERGEHGRRLEALEQLIHQHLGSLVEQLSQTREQAVAEVERATQQLRARTERDVRKVTEALEDHRGEVKALQVKTADAVAAFRQSADSDRAGLEAGLEELRAWRRKAEPQLATCIEAAARVGAVRAERAGESRLAEDLTERLEDQLEAALARERKQAHERLRASCADLTSQVNDLRQELLEQRGCLEAARAAAKAAAAEEGQRREGALAAERERVERAVAERCEQLRREAAASLEGQLGALTTRFQGKLTALQQFLEEHLGETRAEVHKALAALEDQVRKMERALETSESYLAGQAQRWREDSAELRAGLASLQERCQQESDRLLDLAREEARTVHLEVMSVDTRVAALEERLADDPAKRRFDALLRTSGG